MEIRVHGVAKLSSGCDSDILIEQYYNLVHYVSKWEMSGTQPGFHAPMNILFCKFEIIKTTHSISILLKKKTPLDSHKYN